MRGEGDRNLLPSCLAELLLDLGEMAVFGHRVCTHTFIGLTEDERQARITTSATDP